MHREDISKTDGSAESQERHPLKSSSANLKASNWAMEHKEPLNLGRAQVASIAKGEVLMLTKKIF